MVVDTFREMFIFFSLYVKNVSFKFETRHWCTISKSRNKVTVGEPTVGSLAICSRPRGLSQMQTHLGGALVLTLGSSLCPVGSSARLPRDRYVLGLGRTRQGPPAFRPGRLGVEVR